MDTRGPGWFHPLVPAFRPPPRALVNLVFAGALLRLLGLGIHPLWLDEGATWSWASRQTWGGTVFAEANHPPAWWIVTRLWIGAFGDGETSLRAPAAILGILAIPLAWWLGRRLLDPARRPGRGGFDRTPDDGRGARHALWFAGFVTFSTYFTEYAQEARMYSALIVEALGLSLLYLRWLDRADRASLVGYAVLLALALYTHYFAVWIPAGHGAHALWLWWRSRGTKGALRIRPFVLALVGAGVLFLPWIFHFVRHYEGISTGEPYNPFARLFYVLWRVGVGPGLIVVDRLRQAQGVGAVLREELATALWTSVVWFVPLACGVTWLRRARGVAAFVVANLVVPIALLFLVNPFFPLIHERYLVFLAPWLLLLATVGALRAEGTGRLLMTGGLCLLLVVGLVAYHGVGVRLERDKTGSVQVLDGRELRPRYGADPQDPLGFLHKGHPYGKEPWRQAHQFIDEFDREGDLVLLHPGYLHLVWDYYDRAALDRVLLPRDALDGAEIERRFGAQLDGRERVFLVLAHEETEDGDHYFRVLRDLLARRWAEEGLEHLQVVKPILFDRSWGVRVAVFTRR